MRLFLFQAVRALVSCTKKQALMCLTVETGRLPRELFLSSSVLASYTLSWLKMRTQFVHSTKTGRCWFRAQKKQAPMCLTVETGRLPRELFLPSLHLQADFFFGRNANPIQVQALEDGSIAISSTKKASTDVLATVETGRLASELFLSSSVLASYTLSWSKMRTQFKASFKDGLITISSTKKASTDVLATVETGRLASELFLPSLHLQADFFFGRNANPIQVQALEDGSITISSTKKASTDVLAFLWCEKRESNPYGITTRPSNVRVYQFRHSRIY